MPAPRAPASGRLRGALRPGPAGPTTAALPRWRRPRLPLPRALRPPPRAPPRGRALPLPPRADPPGRVPDRPRPRCCRRRGFPSQASAAIGPRHGEPPPRPTPRRLPRAPPKGPQHPRPGPGRQRRRRRPLPPASPCPPRRQPPMNRRRGRRGSARGPNASRGPHRRTRQPWAPQRCAPRAVPQLDSRPPAPPRPPAPSRPRPPAPAPHPEIWRGTARPARPRPSVLHPRARGAGGRRTRQPTCLRGRGSARPG